MTLWWLSFCDGDRPKGQQFLGVSVVDCDNESDPLALVVAMSWRRGCNPGGEVAAMRLPSVADGLTPHAYRNRLLSKAEIEELERIHEKGLAALEATR